MEYGARLLKSYAESRSDPSILRPFQAIQDKAFAWILSSSEARSSLNEGVLGALPVDLRFAHLRCRFQLHLDRSFSQNPLRRILLNGPGLLGKFVSCFRSDALYDRFKRSKGFLHLRENDMMDKETLSEALTLYLLTLRRAYIDGLAKSRKLLTYITCRTECLVDRVLTAPPKYQLTFLAWRRGVLFLNRKCLCGELWTRSHFDCPSLLVKLPTPLEEEFRVRGQNLGGTYGPLDHLLNSRQWELAHIVISKWDAVLQRP